MSPRRSMKEIAVVGNATVAIMDGAYAETLSGVVLGRGINVQIIDADLDLTDGADTLKAVVEVYREKTQEEANAEGPAPDAPAKPDPNKLDRYKKIDRVDIVLTEVKVPREAVDAPIVEEEPAKEPAKKTDAGQKDGIKGEKPKKDDAPRRRWKKRSRTIRFTPASSAPWCSSPRRRRPSRATRFFRRCRTIWSWSPMWTSETRRVSRAR